MTTTQSDGHARSTAWSMSDAQVPSYCDVDLSTDLSVLLPLVAAQVSGPMGGHLQLHPVGEHLTPVGDSRTRTVRGLSQGALR